MSNPIAEFALRGSGGFQLIKDSMLQSDELPLAEVLDENDWQQVFDKHEIDFGNDEDAIYTPAITLWALISQTFFKAEMRSCKAAVGRVAALWATLGKTVCNTNNGAYCRARLKINHQAVREITKQVAARAEESFDQQSFDDQQLHEVMAEVQEVPATGRILLVQPIRRPIKRPFRRTQLRKKAWGFPSFVASA